MKNLETASGYEIVDSLVLPKCSNSYEIESDIHRYFSGCRKKGEWFEADFDNVVNVAMAIYQDNCKFDVKENKLSPEDLTEFLRSWNPDKMFEGGFSKQFIEMAIELGKKMQEIKYLTELLNG